MISSLSAGDEVLLAGGIYGEITSVRPDRLVVRIGDNTKVEVEKAFIPHRGEQVRPDGRQEVTPGTQCGIPQGRTR